MGGRFLCAKEESRSRLVLVLMRCFEPLELFLILLLVLSEVALDLRDLRAVSDG